jgi:hypothetical protein
MASKREKNKAAIPYDEQKHTVITGLGLSGGVLILSTAFWENAKDVASILATGCSPTQLLQLEHLAVDNPSKKLFDAIHTLCLNFTTLSLCGPHLAFAYESTNKEYKTPGSMLLRLILNKVASFQGGRGNVSVEAAYCGDGSRKLNTVEKRKVERIRNGSMGLATARDLVKKLDPNRAFDDRAQYMDCLAALVVLYPKEVKKTHTSGRNLKELLASSCHPDRLEYMLNEARFVRKLSASEREVFQRGVCGNEAFHLEMKNTFTGQSMHPAVLDMKLEHVQVRKLLAHNVALYHPTVKPMGEIEVVHRRVASLDPWIQSGSWTTWCNEVPEQKRGRTPMKVLERAVQSKQLHDWSVKNKAQPSKAMKAGTKIFKSSIFTKAKQHFKLRR